MKNLVLLDKLVGWDSLIPYCRLDRSQLWIFYEFWAQRSKKRNLLDLFTSWAPLKCTSDIGMRTISYMHHTNSTLPHYTSLPCNSAGTRPIQLLPWLCWKKRLAETKKCKVLLSAWTCSLRENCSHKLTAILGKDLRFCKGRTEKS